jgi:hypothetical protein
MEFLSVSGLTRFVTHVRNEDVQVLANRRVARRLLDQCLIAQGEDQYIEFPQEKFDKLLAFLTLNDQQVHYAGSDRTVDIFAFVKLFAELRRKLRDHPAAPDAMRLGSPTMLSPRSGAGGGGGPLGIATPVSAAQAESGQTILS